jgi:hypothetical protein
VGFSRLPFETSSRGPAGPLIVWLVLFFGGVIVWTLAAHAR